MQRVVQRIVPLAHEAPGGEARVVALVLQDDVHVGEKRTGDKIGYSGGDATSGIAGKRAVEIDTV